MLTLRQLSFFLHLGLGVALVHAYTGGLATLLRPATGHVSRIVRTTSTIGLAVVAWTTVIIGTWLVYPGYRATPPTGASLIDYPKSALLAAENTAVWHNFGMEWKEHIGWLVPFIATAIAYLVVHHRDQLERDGRMRRLAAGLFLASLGASIIAAGLGAVINVIAPNQFLNH